MNVFRIAATGAVTAMSFVVEPIDYAMTAVQCVTDGCSLAEVALTVVPGAIGPVAKQIDNVLDVARAAENAGDAVKAIENGGDAIHAAENGSDAAKAAGGCHSFSEDTLVTTADGTELISAIQIGDQVLAYDSQLGLTGYYTVTDAWVHNDPIIEYVTLDDERIETTPGHSFYTKESGWLRADELWVGAHVRNAAGASGTVRAIKFVYRVQPMYDLTVADAHTFFVGQRQWLVHNASCNPFGRRGDPVRHQGRIQDAETQLSKQGWKTESGGSLPEKAYDISSGGKRYPDLVMERKGQRIAIQVGEVTKSGRPISREIRALNDLRSTGKFRHVWFLKKK